MDMIIFIGLSLCILLMSFVLGLLIALVIYNFLQIQRLKNE